VHAAPAAAAPTDDGRLRATPVHAPLAGATIAMVHDIAVSEDYYIVVAGPINFSPTKFVTEYFTSRCSIAECLVYHPSGVTKVHLIPRPRGKAAGAGIQILEAPPMFTFHHVNAYQLPAAAASSSSTGDGSHGGTTTSSSSSSPAELLVLDTVGWDSVSFDANQYNLTPEYYSGGARSQLRRLVFQLPPAASLPSGTNNTTSSSSVSPGRLLSDQQVVTRCVEFPSVAWDMHAKPHTYIYCCGDMVDHPQYWGPAQAVLKVQLAPTAGVQVSWAVTW
jgi:all-trans-8'-apo-beta-carotenal 15,15'-oxygenase